jgi:hypothetical protein
MRLDLVLKASDADPLRELAEYRFPAPPDSHGNLIAVSRNF